MFYFKTGLTRRIRMHPKYFGDKNDPLLTVRQLAKQDFADYPFSPEYGYIIKLIGITEVGDGYCVPLHGFADFGITFDAVVLYPVVGETVYAEVVMVTETCIIFRHACVYGVVRDYSLNDQDFFKYEERPIISKKTKDGPVKESLYRSQTNPSKTIEDGTVVRVRIIKRTLGGNGFFLIGTMFSDHLGPVENPPPMPELNHQKEDDSKVLEKLEIESGLIPYGILNHQKEDDSKVLEKLEIESGLIAYAELQKMWKDNLNASSAPVDAEEPSTSSEPSDPQTEIDFDSLSFLSLSP